MSEQPNVVKDGHKLVPGVVYAIKRPRYAGEGYTPYPWSMSRHSLGDDMFFAEAVSETEFKPCEIPLENAEDAAHFRGAAQEYEPRNLGVLPKRRHPIGGHDTGPDVKRMSPVAQPPLSPAQVVPEQMTQQPAASALESLGTGAAAAETAADIEV